ncbi:GNAT family N-acetyltransferase [Lacimicrobium sp. SS2-24]|uniref:GNAT family N-acetyltransferase n=1 Tax=Lacimicrobium sp. SS2-24 TaxID=2005569 RepID=UPI001AF02529|nr:GNAT family N-acetyltransferase [Lacimicrobium sp. SS2-24]
MSFESDNETLRNSLECAVFRHAREDEVSALVSLLAKDDLGNLREDSSFPLNENYEFAFKAILNDANNELIVLADGKKVLGMMQLTYIPSLTYTGSWRCQVEGVRVDKSMRGKGGGRKMLEFAISEARKRKCKMLQLTSDKLRQEAINFYQRVGFVASHEGMKLML